MCLTRADFFDVVIDITLMVILRTQGSFKTWILSLSARAKQGLIPWQGLQMSPTLEIATLLLLSLVLLNFLKLNWMSYKES